MFPESERRMSCHGERNTASGAVRDPHETASCARGAAVARQMRNFRAASMPQNVEYWITDRPDGRFDVVVKLESGKTVRRTGCVSRAEADTWIEGLRMLMAAIGAPVSAADATPDDASAFGSQTMHDAGHSTS